MAQKIRQFILLFVFLGICIACAASFLLTPYDPGHLSPSTTPGSLIWVGDNSGKLMATFFGACISGLAAIISACHWYG